MTIWDSGKRKKPDRNWADIQKDLNSGMKRKDIYIKYNINKNVIDHGFKMKYIFRN